jgi:transposase
MARYIPYDYNQMQMVPVCLKDQLAPGTLEHAINYLVGDRLNLAVFDERFKNDETGRLAYDPKVLLKVILLAYSRGITQSRRIERACRENIVFIALACGQQPDHSTLAAFISSMEKEVGDLFAQVLLICEAEGLLGGTHFSLDGCKLPSNASKEWTGTFKELEYKKQKLEAKVREAIKEHRQRDQEVEDKASDAKSREKRIERLTRQSERIEKFLEENQPRQGVQGKEIRSNITDPESSYLKTSHGLVQGYNAQALVDAKNQIITTAKASSDNQDFNQIGPVMTSAQETAKAAGLGADYYEGKILTADCNYHSERNLIACEKADLNAYIPDPQFRRRDSRFATQQRHKKSPRRFSLNDFSYDAKNDEYTCPNGRRLSLKSKTQRSGYGSGRWYQARETDCAECPYRRVCLQQPNARRRSLVVRTDDTGITASRRMKQKIDTPEGRKLYQRRLAIVEPVFANIKAHKMMNRFTLRGRVKVDIQWKLFCMIHNIGKILTFRQVLA